MSLLSLTNRIGFMQGRLSPLVNGQIQAFPKENWQNEFQMAYKNNFKILEWTIDDVGFYENPLLTNKGKNKIKELSKKYNLKIPSLTGDFLMQDPFWKSNSSVKKSLEKKFIDLILSCKEIGIRIIVVPLVDNGSIEEINHQNALVEFFDKNLPLLIKEKVQIAFESDFCSEDLMQLLKNFDNEYVGINYDIGNSASLGFNCEEEITLYGDLIKNVHVKDRELQGITVPLGEGNADFEKVFKLLESKGYKGNLILQTARSKEGNHEHVLCKYRDFVLESFDGT